MSSYRTVDNNYVRKKDINYQSWRPITCTITNSLEPDETACNEPSGSTLFAFDFRFLNDTPCTTRVW